MAHFKSSPQDFIQHAFAPMFAVMCTPGVDEVCKKNNLNFVQLIKPFSKASLEGILKDPSSNTPVTIRNLRISFSDIQARPPPPPVARSFFNYSISSNIKEKTVRIVVGDDSIDVPVSTPWFEAWRDTFFQVQYPSDHEFTKHYVGCMIVITSIDTNPLERLEQLLESLQAQINSGPNKLPKWFGTSSVLITFLYLHDNSVSKLDVSVFEAMKVTYGINKCFLLTINSRTPEEQQTMITTDPWEKFLSTYIEYKEEGKEPQRELPLSIETAHEAGEKSPPTTPDILHPLSPIDDENYSVCKDIVSNETLPPHGRLINNEDIEKIKQFMKDFCLKAVIPYFEQCIHQLSDQISNKKGVSRSLFSATKRWFNSNKPGAPGNHISPTAIAYSSDSHELQLRKLGDLCFMIGHYSLAFNAYHSAKRDFGADGAWLHYAGALEMAALAGFMSDSPSESLSRKVVEYAEESIITYQNSCRMNQFATRATLLSVECLKGRGLYGDAAKQLIRMSGEDSDLRSAVLLEQAAYCFLSSLRPIMLRKYAFHMVLAGHRFSKAAHRLHSMRCYSQAYQVYGNKSWSVAEDHILYTIGKHASHLQMASSAVDALSLLVSRSSRQSAQQQELYLKDYLVTIEQLDEVVFSLPVIDWNLTQILLSVPSSRNPPGTISASGFVYSIAEGFQMVSDETVWGKLEEKLVTAANLYGNMLMFKPTIELLTNFTNNSSCSGFVDEPIGVCICLRNPLNIQIILKDVCLLWTMISSVSGLSQDDGSESSAVTAGIINEVVLLSDSSKFIMLTITPKEIGQLHITGLSYTIMETGNGVKVRGKQSLVIDNKNKSDRRFELSITKEAPRLDVSFSGLKQELVSGEVIPFKVFLRNSGNIPISKILVSSSDNFLIASEDNKKTSTIFNIHLEKTLDVSETLEKTFYIQANFRGVTRNLELLFYCESGIENIRARYRLSRHSWPTRVFNSLKSETLCSHSSNSFNNYHQGINIRLRVSSNVFESAAVNNIQLESLNLISSLWKIIPQILPSDMRISRGQSLFLLGKAVKDGNKEKDILSRVSFSNNVMPTWCDYFIPPPPEPTGFPNLDMICVLSWSADVITGEDEKEKLTRKAYGLHYVNLQQPYNFQDNNQDSSSTTPQVSSSQTVDKIKDALSIKVQQPQSLNHQFSSEKLCIVPVKVWLENSSLNELAFKMEACPFPQTCITENNASYHYIWLGKYIHNINLLPATRMCITLLAGISCNGVFDLSHRLKIQVEILNNLVAIIPNPEAVIMIN